MAHLGDVDDHARVPEALRDAWERATAAEPSWPSIPSTSPEVSKTPVILTAGSPPTVAVSSTSTSLTYGVRSELLDARRLPRRQRHLLPAASGLHPGVGAAHDHADLGELGHVGSLHRHERGAALRRVSPAAQDEGEVAHRRLHPHAACEAEGLHLGERLVGLREQLLRLLPVGPGAAGRRDHKDKHEEEGRWPGGKIGTEPAPANTWNG